MSGFREAVPSRHIVYRTREKGRGEADHGWRKAFGRAVSAWILYRADALRPRRLPHANCPGGNLWARAIGHYMERPRRVSANGEQRDVRAHGQRLVARFPHGLPPGFGN